LMSRSESISASFESKRGKEGTLYIFRLRGHKEHTNNVQPNLLECTVVLCAIRERATSGAFLRLIS
jgi:hypothetical protein